MEDHINNILELNIDEVKIKHVKELKGMMEMICKAKVNYHGLDRLVINCGTDPDVFFKACEVFVDFCRVRHYNQDELLLV